MSFRNRLGLFFVLIVIVPMVAVAVLLFRLVGKSEQSMGDADIGARQQVALNIFAEHQDAAQQPLAKVARDADLDAALLAGHTAQATKRAQLLIAQQRLRRIVLVNGTTPVLKAGDKTAIAPALLPLQSDTAKLGTLGVSVVNAADYAGEVRRVTGLEVVVRNGAKTLATTLPGTATPKLPATAKGTVDANHKHYRVFAFIAPSHFPGQDIRVYTLGIPKSKGSHAVRDGRIIIGAILLGFLLLALACAVLVSRSLQQQLGGFLDAARRLAGGDFSAQVSTVGSDEFAGLGEEFNKMARELKLRIDELREAVHESLTDDLTALPNRRAFDGALASEIERVKRFGGTLGVVLIDLDNFKAINDTYGHPQGDVVLREVARVLRDTSREIDHPARYGGEEFALVLPGTDLTGAFELSERVRKGIEATQITRLDGQGFLRVTTSCGVASAPPNPPDERIVVKAADEALYEAKRSGKNKSVRAR